MRILHVAPYYHEAWAYGGIPRLVSTLARGLARRGHDVTVCTTDAGDARSRTRRADGLHDGVRVRVFPNVSNRLAYHLQLFTPVGLARFLHSASRGFDVGHIHACRNLPGTLAASALTRASVPYVVSPNGTALRIERRRLAKLAFDLTVGRRMLPGAARVLAVSAAEIDQLRTVGVPDARLRLLPNPIDDAEFEGGPDGAGFRARHGLGRAPVVLFLGKLTPRKGVDVLVRAFASVRAPSARLVIAGNDMGAGRAVEAAIAASGASRVVRTGLLKSRERLDALAAADVVVYPSRDEVFGLVALEALMCGRPVVVADDSGCGEIVGLVGGGRIVPWGDVAELAAAIDAVLAAPAVWRARADLARRRVRELFSADAVCARLEALYGEVVA